MLFKLGINYMDYGTCNDMYDDDIVYDIVYSVTLCVGMPGGGEER
jgi:hypothetical protein